METKVDYFYELQNYDPHINEKQPVNIQTYNLPDNFRQNAISPNVVSVKLLLFMSSVFTFTNSQKKTWPLKR